MPPDHDAVAYFELRERGTGKVAATHDLAARSARVVRAISDQEFGLTVVPSENEPHDYVGGHIEFKGSVEYLTAQQEW